MNRLPFLILLAALLIISGCSLFATVRESQLKAHKDYVESFGGLDMEMVWIPGGTFRMGSYLTAEQVAARYGGPVNQSGDEYPLHAVTLDGFWMGKYEVTNRQFRCWAPKHSSVGWSALSDFSLDGDQQPVVRVSLEEAKRFCRWLSNGTNRRYSIPTEAQWEYACRGNTQCVRYWGDDDEVMGYYANVGDQTIKPFLAPLLEGREEYEGWDVVPTNDGYVVAAPVGSFQANPFGLYDMIGNVWEWCLDAYDPDFYSRSPETNPVNMVHTEAAKARDQYGREQFPTRGGSWMNISFCQRAAIRMETYDHQPPEVGFRVVRIP